MKKGDIIKFNVSEFKIPLQGTECEIRQIYKNKIRVWFYGESANKMFKHCDCSKYEAVFMKDFILLRIERGDFELISNK